MTEATAPKVMSRQTLHKGRKFDFDLLTIQSPTGATRVAQVVRHPGAVVIVPILPDGRVVLIRNWRASVQESLCECPAGTIEAGEPPAACAPRELEEETGYSAERFVSLGSFYTTPGLTDEVMHAFAATGLRHVGQRLEPDETIEVHPVSSVEALAMIARGELRDAKSMLAILLAERRGLLAARGASREGT